MVAVLTILHVIISVLLCTVVLMQSSKGDGLSGAFGGGGGLPQQMFGSRGMTTALHKTTVYLATGFFITSALLFIVGGRGTTISAKDVVSEARRAGRLPVETSAPAVPLPGTAKTTPQSGNAGTGQSSGGSSQQDGQGQSGGGQH